MKSIDDDEHVDQYQWKGWVMKLLHSATVGSTDHTTTWTYSETPDGQYHGSCASRKHCTIKYLIRSLSTDKSCSTYAWIDRRFKIDEEVSTQRWPVGTVPCNISLYRSSINVCLHVTSKTNGAKYCSFCLSLYIRGELFYNSAQCSVAGGAMFLACWSRNIVIRYLETNFYRAMLRRARRAVLPRQVVRQSVRPWRWGKTHDSIQTHMHQCSTSRVHPLQSISTLLSELKNLSTAILHGRINGNRIQI